MSIVGNSRVIDVVLGRRRQAGFTLLELMVVLTMMGLLFSLVSPDFSSVFPGVEFRRDSTQFAATLRRARSRAIDTRSTTHVEIDARSLTYEILETKVAGKFADGTEFFERGKNIANSLNSTRRITFYADGTATAMRLSLRSSDRVMEINVSWLTGGVKVDVLS